MAAGRSREGAWIEIRNEIGRICRKLVAPVRERGLKFPTFGQKKKPEAVAPVRERGLKCHC